MAKRKALLLNNDEIETLRSELINLKDEHKKEVNKVCSELTLKHEAELERVRKHWQQTHEKEIEKIHSQTLGSISKTQDECHKLQQEISNLQAKLNNCISLHIFKKDPKLRTSEDIQKIIDVLKSIPKVKHENIEFIELDRITFLQVPRSRTANISNCVSKTSRINQGKLILWLLKYIGAYNSQNGLLHFFRTNQELVIETFKNANLELGHRMSPQDTSALKDTLCLSHHQMRELAAQLKHFGFSGIFASTKSYEGKNLKPINFLKQRSVKRRQSGELIYLKESDEDGGDFDEINDKKDNDGCDDEHNSVCGGINSMIDLV